MSELTSAVNLEIYDWLFEFVSGVSLQICNCLVKLSMAIHLSLFDWNLDPLLDIITSSEFISELLFGATLYKSNTHSSPLPEAKLTFFIFSQACPMSTYHCLAEFLILCAPLVNVIQTTQF